MLVSVLLHLYFELQIEVCTTGLIGSDLATVVKRVRWCEWENTWLEKMQELVLI